MRNKTNQVLLVAFYPKALNSRAEAGLLTCSPFRRPSRSFSKETVAKMIGKV
jgi:hypothetical protein